jgi:modulator of FtsH protease
MTTDPMASDIRGVPPALGRDASHELFAQTMLLVAATSGFFALGAYLGRDAPAVVGWLCFAGAFLTLIGIGPATRRSDQRALGMLFLFGTLIGLSVAPTLAYYANTDPSVLWQAGGATALFIAGFGAVGYTTRRDLSALARILTFALLALIVFGFVAIIVNLPGADLIYSILGLAIFAGLVAFDFQRLRRTQDIRSAPLLAASIFLDALNVFLFFLSFFGGSDR